MKRKNKRQRAHAVNHAELLSAFKGDSTKWLNQLEDIEATAAQLQMQALSSVAQKWELVEQLLADETAPHSLKEALKGYQASLSIAIGRKVKIDKLCLLGF